MGVSNYSECDRMRQTNSGVGEGDVRDNIDSGRVDGGLALPVSGRIIFVVRCRVWLD